MDVIEALLGPGPGMAADAASGNDPAEDEYVPTHRGMRTAAQRRRAIERAERELEKKGI
jgi:hypothetical protein